MNRRTISLTGILLLVILTGKLLVSCGPGSNSSSSSDSADGASLMQERCTVCHSTSRITAAHKTAVEWTDTVQRMIDRGALLDATEQQTLIDYLAEKYK